MAEPDFNKLAREARAMFPGARNARLRAARLGRLSAMLKRLQPTKERHFHLDNWEEQKPCGTAACAIGYATLDPWFTRRGFRRIGWGHSPRYRGDVTWRAISNFFRVAMADDGSRVTGAPIDLFYSASYAKRDRGNPKVVAARIDKLLSALKSAA